MRYRLVEKFWSLFGDAFIIRDGEGREVYRVKRRKSDGAERIAVEDANELELASVSVEPGFRWRLRWGAEAASALVSKEQLSALRWRLVIDAPGLDGEIQRQRRRFALIAGGAEVASISQGASLFRDSFAVELTPGIDPLLVLTVAVVVALCDRN